MNELATRPEQENGDEHKAELVTTTAINALTRAEIDMQVATAKQYPRNIGKFKSKATEMATYSEEVAASCFYTLPARKGGAGKPITGPSVRLAEICALAWGNIRFGARTIGDDGRLITAQGFCMDVESNVVSTIEVKRRVTDRTGRRFSDDMVMVTCNAACSIAKRQAILGVVPLPYVKEVETAARRTAIGDAKTLATKRADMLAYFAKMGLAAERVYAAVGKKGLDDIGLDELSQLKGLATAIKDGDTTIEEAFPIGEPEAKKTPSRIEAVKEKIANGNVVDVTPEQEQKPAVPVAAEQPAPAEVSQEVPETPVDPAELEREDRMQELHRQISEASNQADLQEISDLVQQNAEWLGGMGAEALRQHLATKKKEFGRKK